MSRHFLFLLVCICCIPTLLYSQAFSLSGTIHNENGPLNHATVSINNGLVVTSSDATGSFKIHGLKAGQYTVAISFSGYQPYQTTVVIRNSHIILPAVLLNPLVQELQGVTIVENSISQRKEESVFNLEVVNGDFLKRHMGGSLMQTLERLPGVKTIGIGAGQSKPLIRGLGFNRVLAIEKGIKHEGQQWGADHGLEIDQFAAGEVELVKGAASFIYGSDAIGGVVDVKPPSNPPQNSTGGAMDLVGKSNNRFYGTSLNLYHRKTHWFVDGRITYQNYSDYRVPTDFVYVYDYAVKLHKQHLRNTAGRETSLHGTVGYVKDQFRSVFYVSNIYSKSGFFANAHGLEPRQVDAGVHDATARDIQMPNQQVNHLKLINRSTYKTGVHRLELDLGFQHNFRQEFSPYVNHGYMPAIYPDSLTIPRDLEREFDKEVYSLHLRDGISVGKHTVATGLTAEYQDNAINGWSFLVPAFKQGTAGAYLYDKFQVNKHLILHGALRYDVGRIQMAKYIDWFPSERTQDGTTVFEKLVRADPLIRRFHSLVWSFGFNYNLDKLTLKANIGKSFRMPIAKELAANGVNYHYFSYERGNANLNPEQSYQLDLGFGYRNEKLTIQLSPFYNYFPNYIYLNPTADHDYYYGAGNQVFKYTQSQVMRYGGEFQFKYQVLHNLSTELLTEYLYAEQLSGSKKGYTLPFSPPPSALLNITWSPNLIYQLQNSYLSVDYRLTAAQNNIVPPEKKSPGYSLINIQGGTRVSLYKQPVIVSLQAQNILNTRYLNHTSFYRLIELPEAGRNIILSLKIPYQIKSPINNKIN